MFVSKTLQVQSNLVIRCNKVPQLTSCRVGNGERFGTLAHWSLLIESTRFPNNIVVYVSSEKQFFVVCANAALTQRANTKSAICWLRDRAGAFWFVLTSVNSVGNWVRWRDLAGDNLTEDIGRMSKCVGGKVWWRNVSEWDGRAFV